VNALQVKPAPATHDARFTVLGGQGFIGSHLVRHLRARGHTCWVPDRDDPALFERELGHVVYAIGLTADFRSRPLATVEAHVCALRQVLAAGRFDTLTYLSSTRVYAGASSTREDASLRVDPQAASDLYNLSKLMGEALCLHCGHAGMKVARLSNIVGAHGRAAGKASFIDQLLEEGLRTGQVHLQTALESAKDYLSIADATDTLARIALSPHCGIFNVASGVGVTNEEIVRLLECRMGWQVSVDKHAPAWGFERIDVSRVQGLFGSEPQPFAAYFCALLRALAPVEGIA
jgi:nucleoside-diphosphate-sugar epimerase